MDNSMKHTAATDTEGSKIVTDTDQSPAWFANRTHCPSWCVGQHLESLAEGCDLELAATHTSADRAGTLHALTRHGKPVLPDRGSWGVQLLEQPTSIERGISGEPVICLESNTVEYTDRVALPLTSGEARVLAAQLVHLADMADWS